MPVARYQPSRHYLTAGFIALGLAAFSTWCGLRWSPTAYLPAVLFLASAALILVVAFQSPVEIHETHLRIRGRNIAWSQIRRLDRTGWVSPLVLHITLLDDDRIMMIYPGDLDSATALLRQLRRYSREALIDGVPYRQFWGDALGPTPDRRPLPSPKYQLLRPEDEAEVERMLQRLKTVGHIDPKNSSDEK
jgi:hypothetical protein